MRVLMVAPWVPGKTRPRSMAIIRELSVRHEVSLLCVGTIEDDVAALQRVLGVSHLEVVPVPKLAAIARTILALFTGRSLQQAFLDDPAMRRALRSEHARFRPDVLYFNVIRTCQFMGANPDQPIIVDLDEFRSHYYEQLATTSRNWIWRAVAKVEASRLRAAELRVLKLADRVLVSSPTDLSPSRDSVRLVRSAHAMDETDSNGNPHPRSIVFVGRQSYRANHEAIIWFIENVLPALAEKYPDVHLNVVGEQSPKSLLELQSKHVTVTGRVPDVSRSYLESAVSIVPVRMATGVQMKLIESMSLGTATVVTPVVAQGAGLIGSEHCLVADSREEWVDAIAQLIEDHALRSRIAANGLSWVQANHSKQAVQAQLERALDGTPLGRPADQQEDLEITRPVKS